MAACFSLRRQWVVLIALFVLLSIATHHGVNGQRAITNLGIQLKQRLPGSRNKQRENTILEGERNKSKERRQRRQRRRKVKLFLQSAVIAVVTYWAVFRPKKERVCYEEEDFNLSVKDPSECGVANSWRVSSQICFHSYSYSNSLLLFVVVVVLSGDVVVKDDQVKAQEAVDLSFDGIRLELDHGRKGKKLLLDGSIRGRAQPGRMLAILGPSGAGKSSLLHALSGQIKDSTKLKLYGRRFMNGEAVSGDSMLPSAFIEQDVEFFPHMTVRETLRFRVDLKLGSQLSKKARLEMVEDLMQQLGLTKVAETAVGNSKVRGISGGERKRLSIAVEMISSPSLIMLDEPTSGLDSTAATALIDTLRELADQGKTVIAVIHQPSQHVFNKFDDLLLVSEGKQVYFGERSKVRSYMESNACRAESAEMGTAEHVLDCITRMPIEQETMEEAEERLERLSELATKQNIDLGKINTKDSQKLKQFYSGPHGGPKASLFVQFKLLAQRSLREVKRSKGVILIKVVQQVTTALIYGGIYSLGYDQASIQDRFGLLSLIAIGASNMAIASSIRSFPREKTIVSKELANKMYRTLPYFIGKAISELPLVGFFNGVFGAIVYRLTGLNRAPGRFGNFLLLLTTHGLVSEAAGLVIGAFSPNSDVALALFPAILVLNIIFDGKNISEENTPRLLKWVPKLGLIRWGFEVSKQQNASDCVLYLCSQLTMFLLFSFPGSLCQRV
jgi:ABC-type multidrug transport system ATPase subunit